MLIDKTERYCFERISPDRKISIKNRNQVSTLYLHSGESELEILSDMGKDIIKLSKGQGAIISPKVKSYNIIPECPDNVIYKITSDYNGNPLKEFLDKGEKKEVDIEYFRIIDSPKTVIKPWGQEIWISWLKDYHVLKQITMKGGHRSSLQFHREKLETNYLESGSAMVIDGIKLNPNISEEESQNSLAGVDLNQYAKIMTTGSFWTSQRGTVHRVISLEDYLAYEVSTPELDDVIRIQDDLNRVSGRINSEHEKGRG
jgi:mannose-6-phosphate isomerase